PTTRPRPPTGSPTRARAPFGERSTKPSTRRRPSAASSPGHRSISSASAAASPATTRFLWRSRHSTRARRPRSSPTAEQTRPFLGGHGRAHDPRQVLGGEELRDRDCARHALDGAAAADPRNDSLLVMRGDPSFLIVPTRTTDARAGQPVATKSRKTSLLRLEISPAHAQGSSRIGRG